MAKQIVVIATDTCLQPSRGNIRFESMKVGDRVRVKKEIIIYTHPEHRGKPFDVKAFEGEVITVLENWKGRPISPNLPILVKFDKKFKLHFRQEELDVID